MNCNKLFCTLLYYLSKEKFQLVIITFCKRYFIEADPTVATKVALHVLYYIISYSKNLINYQVEFKLKPCNAKNLAKSIIFQVLNLLISNM